MPLESSRRLLSGGGRYTQLPPVPEEISPLYYGLQSQNLTDGQRHNYVNTTLSYNYDQKRNNTTNGAVKSLGGISTSIHSLAHAIKPSYTNLIRSSRSDSASAASNGHGLRSFSSTSSLVHTEGAVVPRQQPHHTQLYPQPYVQQLIPALHTEVRLNQGRTYVHPVTQQRNAPTRPLRARQYAFTRTPINRPCFKSSKSSPSPPPIRPPRQRRGETLLRSVTSRGRGGYRYENLDSGPDSEYTTESPTTSTQSGESSSSPSPPYTPPPRSPHPGILINTALARQGIKRLTR